MAGGRASAVSFGVWLLSSVLDSIGLLALPFLQSLLPKAAGAQAATAPKRFIVLKIFSTQLIKQWYPTFQGNGYALKNSKYNDSRGDGSTLLTQKLANPWMRD